MNLASGKSEQFSNTVLERSKEKHLVIIKANSLTLS